MITYKEFDKDEINKVMDIYKSIGWNAYLADKDKLVEAFDNSLYVFCAYNESEMIGFKSHEENGLNGYCR